MKIVEFFSSCFRSEVKVENSSIITDSASLFREIQLQKEKSINLQRELVHWYSILLNFFPHVILGVILEFLNGSPSSVEEDCRLLLNTVSIPWLKLGYSPSRFSPLITALLLNLYITPPKLQEPTIQSLLGKNFAPDVFFQKIPDIFLNTHVTAVRVSVDAKQIDYSLNLASELLKLDYLRRKNKISDHIFTFYAGGELPQAFHIFSAYLKVSQHDEKLPYNWIVFYRPGPVAQHGYYVGPLKEKIEPLLNGVLEKLRDFEKLKNFCRQAFAYNLRSEWSIIYFDTLVNHICGLLHSCLLTKNRELHDEILRLYGELFEEKLKSATSLKDKEKNAIRETIQTRNYFKMGSPALFREYPVNVHSREFTALPDFSDSSDDDLPELVEVEEEEKEEGTLVEVHIRRGTYSMNP